MGRAASRPHCPAHLETISKADTPLRNVDEIIAALSRRIVAVEHMALIGVYDRYGDTTRRGGMIAPEIQDAKEIVFCVGGTLHTADGLAACPYAIGVADLGNRFVVSLPVGGGPLAFNVLADWIEGLRV